MFGLTSGFAVTAAKPTEPLMIGALVAAVCFGITLGFAMAEGMHHHNVVPGFERPEEGKKPK